MFSQERRSQRNILISVKHLQQSHVQSPECLWFLCYLTTGRQNNSGQQANGNQLHISISTVAISKQYIHIHSGTYNVAEPTYANMAFTERVMCPNSALHFRHTFHYECTLHNRSIKYLVLQYAIWNTPMVTHKKGGGVPCIQYWELESRR